MRISHCSTEMLGLAAALRARTLKDFSGKVFVSHKASTFGLNEKNLFVSTHNECMSVVVLRSEIR